MLILFLFLIGLLFGSFANVYFYRMPQSLSVCFPRSFCPNCQKKIAWFDNVPLISYFLLRGQCRHCQNPISWKYPVIEAACGALFAVVSVNLTATPLGQLCAFLFFAFMLYLMGGIDVTTYFQNDRAFGIIPDPLTGTLAVSGLLYASWNPVINFSLESSVLTGGGSVLILLALRWSVSRALNKESLGLGDVKMVGALGVWLGWQGVTVTLVAGSLIGSVFSLTLIYLHKMDRNTPVPFGPFLALGGIISLWLLTL